MTKNPAIYYLLALLIAIGSTAIPSDSALSGNTLSYSFDYLEIEEDSDELDSLHLQSATDERSQKNLHFFSVPFYLLGKPSQSLLSIRAPPLFS